MNKLKITKHEIGRLAFRAEREFWNCYWCPNQMDIKGRVLMGSIRLHMVTRSIEHKQEFMDLMQEGFANQVEEVTGTRPTWNRPVIAPESERHDLYT